jgi:epoxyqueuosine reductase
VSERVRFHLNGPVDPRGAIRAAALDLGFTAAGFAPAEPPAHADAYLAWLAAGHHADMVWMAREDAVRRRLDPREALPGCRTLIMLLLAHRGGFPEAGPDRSGDAIVARYAAGRDYHEVFEEKLRRLSVIVESLGAGAKCKPYVDYGPVLERDHAQRAGLGWIGKNTLLIDPARGSWLLIGELLTTLELLPDEPFLPDRCGSCTRCIEACPTGAIVEDRVVDSRRCISWLTIENRGSIPAELRPLIGNRVFGCDICQEVCPWNRDPAPVPRGELELGRPIAPETLAGWAEQLLELDDGSFRERYRGTALARPGREGLLRNLCVGLGNAADPASAALLERCAADESEIVREHARWALSRVRRSPAAPRDRR